jgi:hypothetical protein
METKARSKKSIVSRRVGKALSSAEGNRKIIDTERVVSI